VGRFDGMVSLCIVGNPYLIWLRQSCSYFPVTGADPKSVQGQMRHSRISTTMDIYAQIVPAAQRQAIKKLADFACHTRVTQNGPLQ
jgi:integrase